MVWVVSSIVVFAAITWLSRQAGVWLLLMSIPLYLVQFEITSVPTTLLEVFIYTAALIFVVQNYKGLWRRIIGTFQPIFFPVVLIFIGLVVGTIVTPDLRLSLGIFKGWFIDPVILYFLVVNAVDWRKIEHFVLALLMPTLPMSILAIWQALTGNFITVDGRASSWFVSANYLSMYLVPILLLGLIVLVSKNKVYQILTALAWLLGLAALYFSFSYGGWLGLLGAGIVGVFVYLHRYWKVWIWAGLIPITLFISQLGNDRFVQMLDLTKRSSASVRLQVWQTGLLMFKEHWLTGIGLGQFRDQYLSYSSRLFNPPWELAILHAHNLFLQFAVNLGLAGLAGFIWLIVNFFIWFRKNSSYLATVLIMAMSAMLIHGLIDTTYWKNDLAALFWVVIALAVLVNGKSKVNYE